MPVRVVGYRLGGAVVRVDGHKLRGLRERRVMTLRELADASGVGFDTISRIENGHQEPRPGTVRKLAQALGVEAGELVAWRADDEGPETGKAAA